MKNKRAYDRAYHAKRTPAEKAHKVALQRRLIRTKIMMVLVYKATHPCVGCGERDPIVLDFDHREQSEKLFQIADGMRYAPAKIMAEIAKCDVLCANCHRRRTAKQMMYYQDAWLYD